MALPILDGNQTAATLSTVLTSGEHIPAHTVVSLGSQAITDVRSAVSGSVVSISNFPASQSTTFGAVTGSVSVLNFPSTQTIAGTVTIQTDLTTAGNEPCVVLGYSTPGGMTRVNYLSGLPIQATTTVPVSGTVTANPAGVQTISGTVTANLSTDVTLNGIDQNDLVANVLNGGGIPVYPRDNTSLNGSFPISGTVTVGNSVTIGSLPAISGTVTIGAVSTSVTVSQIQGTSVTTSNFTSTTASQTLVSANSARRGLTVFNEGAGNLHICAGATATTLAYQVRLSAGDYWECPTWQTALTHSAQFSSAGTARVVEII